MSAWLPKSPFGMFSRKQSSAPPLDSDPEDFAKFLDRETAKKHGIEPEPPEPSAGGSWFRFVPDPLGVGKTVQAIKDRVAAIDAKRAAERRRREEARRKAEAWLQTIPGKIVVWTAAIVLTAACLVASFFIPPLGIGGTLLLFAVAALCAKRS